ncbi:MAG TPA: thioesterase family protein [Bacteroidales bacterium]|nr:thioesterase family protein [Bacteroidales bacterium]
MYSYETKIRVRYNETDRMGYLHHSVYVAYFEVARTEMMRSLGTSYKELEDSGILLPVYALNISYRQPAFYDDELTVKSTLAMLPVVKLIIEYEVLNPDKQVICTATSTNVFVSALSRKPVRAPETFLEKFNKFFD